MLGLVALAIHIVRRSPSFYLLQCHDDLRFTVLALAHPYPPSNPEIIFAYVSSEGQVKIGGMFTNDFIDAHLPMVVSVI